MKNDLASELKKSAKRANQRLVRLEQAGLNSPAYQITQNDIESMLGRTGEKGRFHYGKNMTYAEMEKELKYVNKFLNMASSTSSGMKAVVKKRDKTLMQRYGTSGKDLTNLYRVLSGDAFKHASELLPSSIIVSSVVDALSNGKSVRKINNVLEDMMKQENDGYLYDFMQEKLGLETEDEEDY